MNKNTDLLPREADVVEDNASRAAENIDQNYLEGYDYGYGKGYSKGQTRGFEGGARLGELLGKYHQARITLKEINNLIDYYEQPQDRFEMGFRQGLYRAKMWAEEEFKKREKELNSSLD